MRTVVELSEKDIAQIIANKFEVDAKSVVLSAKEVWRGQGPAERKVWVAFARVTTKGDVFDENA